MEDRRFLHEGERLLASLRPSAANLVVDLIRGLLDTFLISLVLLVILTVIWWFSFAASPLLFVMALLVFIVLFAVSYRRWRLWLHATFRVTTERILLQHHASLFASRLTTIKWPQYQESFIERPTILDLLFRARPIGIRYGTADAQLKTSFPSLRYATDLKHYLDKVDSAARKGHMDEQSLRPFVAKPRGRRDAELKIEN
ncbi:hypothetical protein HYR82_01705 [Candidatus Peregrinibacteria bacterium]|nr:hypothetical protein [Candidatus Peregrinibacteria bacterium]